jgi:cell wall-associated NlpC family hydrolase
MRWGWIAAAALASACASTGYTPRPFPAGTPDGTGSRHSPGFPPAAAASPVGPFDGYALVGTALALRGAPYRNGGTDPNGFDCSGFTQYVFAQYGIALPRGVHEQYRWGKSVDAQDLAPGDLVFFATTQGDASHVAIVVGSDQFVHAPSSDGVVRVERLRSSYWSQRYVGARRLR